MAVLGQRVRPGAAPRRALGAARRPLRAPLATRLLRWVLPALAVALVATLAVLPQIDLDRGRFRIDITPERGEPVASASMTNVRVQGVDDEGRPYSISAAELWEDPGDEDVVELRALSADILLDDGRWIAVMADAGRYRRAADRIEFAGQVSLFEDRGYELTTSALTVDLETREVASTAPVTGHGPLGEIDAEGLRVVERGERIMLLGRSRLLVRAGESGGS